MSKEEDLLKLKKTIDAISFGFGQIVGYIMKYPTQNIDSAEIIALAYKQILPLMEKLIKVYEI